MKSSTGISPMIKSTFAACLTSADCERAEVLAEVLPKCIRSFLKSPEPLFVKRADGSEFPLELRTGLLLDALEAARFNDIRFDASTGYTPHATLRIHVRLKTDISDDFEARVLGCERDPVRIVENKNVYGTIADPNEPKRRKIALDEDKYPEGSQQPAQADNVARSSPGESTFSDAAPASETNVMLGKRATVSETNEACGSSRMTPLLVTSLDLKTEAKNLRDKVLVGWNGISMDYSMLPSHSRASSSI